MTTPIAVAVPVYNRTDYLARALEGWSRVRGVEDAVFEFSIEPGSDDAVDLCRSVGFAERHWQVNRHRLGHDQNMLRSMKHGFDYADYAIQALDDYIPSTDILEMHGWHRDRYRRENSVLALTSGRDIPAPFGGLSGIWRCQLIGALSGFHRHKWGRLVAKWAERDRYPNWWWWINYAWLQSGPGYDVLFPALSRAEDIGETDSDGNPVPTFTTQQSCFVADPPPQAYIEIQSHIERGFQREVRSIK